MNKNLITLTLTSALISGAAQAEIYFSGFGPNCCWNDNIKQRYPNGV